jgi:YVTN family beta-propeller protein
VTAMVTVGSNPAGVSVNPAGTRVYVANSNSGNVSVIDTAANAIAATVAVGTVPYSLGNFIGPAPAAPASATSIPTLSEWGLIVLAGLMALFGLTRVAAFGRR